MINLRNPAGPTPAAAWPNASPATCIHIASAPCKEYNVA